MSNFGIMVLAACCLGQVSPKPDWRKIIPAGVRDLGSARLQWETVCATPSGYCPQGLDGWESKLYLSAHYNNSRSALFELDEPDNSFRKLFDLPEDATHTSGIAFARRDRLFAVDYHSNAIYLIDCETSKKDGKAAVLTSTESGLKGTSACCIVEIPDAGPRLLVTDFMHSNRNVFFKFNLADNTLKSEDDRSYRNYGFSQGVKSHHGFMYETGNRILRPSYVVRYRLEDALNAQQIQPVNVWDGPHPKIEDLAFRDGYAYLTDEQTNCLYRVKFPPAPAATEGK